MWTDFSELRYFLFGSVDIFNIKLFCNIIFGKKNCNTNYEDRLCWAQNVIEMLYIKIIRVTWREIYYRDVRNCFCVVV